MIQDVVINLSATRAQAEKFGNDIFYYEKRIAEVTPNRYELLNPVHTYNAIKVSELKVTAASVSFRVWSFAHMIMESIVLVDNGGGSLIINNYYIHNYGYCFGQDSDSRVNWKLA